ncbi:uncharacterized protein LOC131657983 [Vicia villosa]|uniref:uncharacterized protein LOC131657983 n=1 Tax=Vicia villosa TaxID=3911 RepID=UPI00273B2761|nr:uncharacterized protein LOC131657983 [Vicia villosa]
MVCERKDTYQPNIRKLKRDDTRSRKYECPLKSRGYYMVDETWKFNVIYGIHNHALNDKLAGHPIVCRLVPGGRELVLDMTLNMVASKNILASLKWKIPLNVSNIKQIYNVHTQDNKAVRGPRSKMQQLLKLLEDGDYVSRYKVCDDKVTVRDIL